MNQTTLPLAVAGLTGPFAIAVDRLITWARNRRRDDAAADKLGAEAALTIDQRWQNLADELRNDVADLRQRVTSLEQELAKERDHAKGLEAEVDRYRSIARSLIRHVLRLRDALAKTDVEMPSIPQDIEDALTGIDLP
jgi:phage shock protein A